MTTITIDLNGHPVTFSNEVPKRAGPYLFKRKPTSEVQLVDVVFRGNDKQIYMAGYTCPIETNDANLWCPLVSASLRNEQVEKAYREGWADGIASEFIECSHDWTRSIARRITEGQT